MSQKIKQDISLGSNLRKLRKQAHLTQEQVVARLLLQGIDISRSIYSQMECGTYDIKVSELIVLANLFKVCCNTFFENLQLTLIFDLPKRGLRYESFLV